MTDTGVALIHFIHLEWVKQKITNSLVFNIAYFFSSLNHHLLSLILRKVGFNPKVERLGISETISLLLFSMLMWEWVKDQPSLSLYLLFIYLPFFKFLKNN